MSLKHTMDSVTKITNKFTKRALFLLEYGAIEKIKMYQYVRAPGSLDPLGWWLGWARLPSAWICPRILDRSNFTIKKVHWGHDFYGTY